MTVEYHLPPIPSPTLPDRMSLGEWTAEGVRRFGADQNDWLFCCVACGTVYGPADFARLGARANRAASECIGRVFIEQRAQGLMPAATAATEDRGCDWHAGGPHRADGVVDVIVDASRLTRAMPFAEPSRGVPATP